MTLIGCIKFGRTDEAKQIRKESMKNGIDYTPHAKKEIIGLDLDKMNKLTTASNKDNLVMQINPCTESGGKQPYQQNRVYDIEGISPALLAEMSCKTHAILVPEDSAIIQRGRGFNKGGEHKDKSPPLTSNSWDHNNTLRIRRLTPIECCRLQTVPDNYFKKDGKYIVSETQVYKMLGNGWTIDVIAHIFSYLPEQFFKK